MITQMDRDALNALEQWLKNKHIVEYSPYQESEYVFYAWMNLDH